MLYIMEVNITDFDKEKKKVEIFRRLQKLTKFVAKVTGALYNEFVSFLC